METQSKPQTDLALAAVDQSINALFNRAPVMRHWVRKGGTIAKVNRRWLARMGYKRHEVLGRKSIDFLTEHSRFWAVEECLPLFFRVGSARGVGFEFVKRMARFWTPYWTPRLSPFLLASQHRVRPSASPTARKSRTGPARQSEP